MEKQKKVCPFKKRIKISMANGQRIYKDQFAWCDYERCMAYRNGECLKLTKGVKNDG